MVYGTSALVIQNNEAKCVKASYSACHNYKFALFRGHPNDTYKRKIIVIVKDIDSFGLRSNNAFS